MRDSFILSRMLKEFGITQQAIARYEEDMFPCANDVIEWERLRGFMEMMASDNPLVKISLDY